MLLMISGVLSLLDYSAQNIRFSVYDICVEAGRACKNGGPDVCHKYNIAVPVGGIAVTLMAQAPKIKRPVFSHVLVLIDEAAAWNSV